MYHLSILTLDPLDDLDVLLDLNIPRVNNEACNAYRRLQLMVPEVPKLYRLSRFVHRHAH
jgi:hypothetical protein